MAKSAVSLAIIALTLPAWERKGDADRPVKTDIELSHGGSNNSVVPALSETIAPISTWKVMRVSMNSRFRTGRQVGG